MKAVIQRRELISSNERLTHIPGLLERIYRARGVQSSQELERELTALLPFHQLSNIDTAVMRIAQALRTEQSIMIIGDFDADGATSTAVMVTALKQFGATRVNFIVPNRFEYGYGLTPEIVDLAAQQQPALIITVDNGVTSVEGVARAQELGIDVIITDHHLPGQVIPAAVAIVNPNMPGDQFSSKNLAGVGVAFYVMIALRRHLETTRWFTQKNIAMPNMAHLLDLVALGTVADLVALDKNNRILVYQGLKRIQAGYARPGIQALVQVAGRDSAQLTAQDLGFLLGPRLNAAGRIDDMTIGIHCLLAPDLNSALPLAAELDGLNRQRRMIEADMQQQAQRIVDQLQLTADLPLGLCLYQPDWHQGVIGLVASKIKDRVHRPVIAFARSGDEELKGSARSIEGLHIRDVLQQIATEFPGIINKFGGHAMAAGLSLPLAQLNNFTQAFTQVLQQHLSSNDLQQYLWTDGELSEPELNLATVNLLQQAGPFGQKFPEPCFDNVFYIKSRKILAEKHLKLMLALTAQGNAIQAIAFNATLKNYPETAEKMRMVYSLQNNIYQGVSALQLIIHHAELVNA